MDLSLGGREWEHLWTGDIKETETQNRVVWRKSRGKLYNVVVEHFATVKDGGLKILR